ncbi:MAG: F0F1 ATP synthase subunit delta [Candidatus Omnitrophota bacterium]
MPSSLIVSFVVLQIATVTAIVLFLRMLLHKQLEIGLSRIKKMDKENLEKEVLLNDKIQKLNEEYDKRLGDAERQADGIINMAKEDAKKVRDEERGKAKEEAKKIISSALDERDRVARQTKNEISRKAVDFSVRILKKMLSEEELKSIRTSSARETMDIMMSSGDMDELLGKENDMEIITADELTAKDREYILASVGERFGKDKKAEFSVNKEILGGLVIKIGESIIDGGLEMRIIKAAKELKEEI